MDEPTQIAITFMSGPLDGKTMTWEAAAHETEKVLNIGRREGCDIMLDYDSQVSRLHARVIYDLGNNAFYLQDMDSRNGTFLNDANNRIKGRVPLLRGELFRVGRTWLRVDPAHSEPDDDESDDDSDLPF
jgi:predicted component of type VI protein secretion system